MRSTRVAGQGSPVPTLVGRAAQARAPRRRRRRRSSILASGRSTRRSSRSTRPAPPSSRRCRQTEFDPRELEQAEERLFALRAAARKYDVPADGSPSSARALRRRRAAIDAGEEELGALERAVAEAEAAYVAAARTLSAGRRRAAKALDGAVQKELPPLKLERARFITEIASDEEGRDPGRVRPGRVLGPDQSRHAARAADEGRLGRRARRASCWR